MRIIAGRFGGRRLVAPKSGTRPTTDRTREAIFNLLAARLDLSGEPVLDLFAGSGALGFEALSRGAAHVTFVERGGEALAAIRANAAELGVEEQCSIVRSDVFRFLEGGATARYLAVFADPPYDLAGVEHLPARVLPLLETGGRFVLEHPRRTSFTAEPLPETTRTYGRTAVSLFRRNDRGAAEGPKD